MHRNHNKVASQDKSDIEVENEAAPAIPPRLYLDDEFISEQEDNANKCLGEDEIMPAVPPRRYLEDEEFASEQTDSAIYNNAMRSEEEDIMPAVPPRRYLEDEEFASELQDNAKTGNITTATSDEHYPQGHFKPEMPQTSEETAHIYQPLLPKRACTEAQYEPLTFKGATRNKEQEEVAEGIDETSNTYQPLTFQGATRNEERATGGNNSHYQPLIFKRSEKQEAGESEQLTPKADSEASHYQPLVFPKGKQPRWKHATHVMMTFDH